MRAFNRNDASASTSPSLSERLKALPTSVRLIGVVFLMALLSFSGWFTFEAFQAKSSLEQAKSSAERSKEALLGGRSDDATQAAETAQFHARAAR